MNFTLIKIKNFKAIDDITISDIAKFNVIVGTNGSGKSSVLQALHWVLQSGRNLAIRPEKAGHARVLLSSLADYMPSPDYKNAGHGGTYGNQSGKPRLDITLTAEVVNEDSTVDKIDANLWIRSAKNEGISIHIPSRNPLTAQIRNQSREISAYIPGLAGIPASEAKLSKRVIHRQAAAGDANTVLRNLLYLLKSETDGAKYGANKLEEVLHWVSKVLGKLSLNVSFDDEKDFSIQATFATQKMKSNGQPEKPLELAGIGFLQVIQIFAYLIFYRPQLLLVDEPDSHLHPNKQEELVRVLFEAAQEYDCQVIMTTHSPSVVRAMPSDAKLIWMKEGKVVENLEGARAQMGWGLLDKTVLLLSEDKNTDMLREIISQWPEIDRKVAVWPLHGVGKTPRPEVLAELTSVFGKTLKLAIHQDADFMLKSEKPMCKKPYEDQNISVWITSGSDIEAYFCNAAYMESIGVSDAAILLANSLNEDSTTKGTFEKKRKQINKQDGFYPNGAGTPSNDKAAGELNKGGFTGIHIGKTVFNKLEKEIRTIDKPLSKKFGKTISNECEIAPDLKSFLEKLV